MSPVINIDEELCIGCGSCVKDCFPKHLKIEDGKAVTTERACMGCGHCIAVCPKNAVTLEGADMAEIIEKADVEADIDPDVYMNHLKLRRSIRRFKDRRVEREKIERLLDAGRFSPTGSNLQNVQYTVLQENNRYYTEKILKILAALGEQKDAPDPGIARYAARWKEMLCNYEKDDNDELFFHSPCVIIVSSSSPQAAIIAAAHMETMVYAEDLGMLYSGFTARAIRNNEELKTELGIHEEYDPYAVLVIGYPDVSYIRSVPRNKADVTWN